MFGAYIFSPQSRSAAGGRGRSPRGCHDDQAQNELQGLSSAIFWTLVTWITSSSKMLSLLNPPCHESASVGLYPPKIYSFIHNFSQIYDFEFEYRKASVEHKLYAWLAATCGLHPWPQVTFLHIHNHMLPRRRLHHEDASHLKARDMQLSLPGLIATFSSWSN